MGKLMVAEGLGVAVLPDFCVAGDPLERHGEIIYREIEDEGTTVVLILHRSRAHRDAATAELRSRLRARAATGDLNSSPLRDPAALP